MDTPAEAPELLVPAAQRQCGMFIADPEVAERLKTAVLALGGQASTFLGFTFITLESPERTLEKRKIINRLEWHRRAREEARLNAKDADEANSGAKP